MTSVVVFTLVISLVSISYLIILAKKRKRIIVKYLLLTLLFLNSIWYSVLLLNLLELNVFSLKIHKLYLGLEILFSSLLFFSRFLFLIAFFLMVVKILNYKPSKTFILAFRITVIVIVVFWLLGWMEFLLFGSKGITDSFLLYSDILIFFSIIIASVYLLSQTKYIQDKLHQRAIKLLCLIFILNISLGFFRWLINDSISIENEIIESLSIHVLVILFNGLIMWWAVVYKDLYFGTMLFMTEKTKSDMNELITKYNISKRELEVIQLICEGYSNKEIAERLFISLDTVKDHNGRIFLKTGLKNRTQLAKMFLQ